jgi:hypothetical protein
MDEDTTTEASVDTGVEETQPVETEEAEAVQDTAEPEEEQTAQPEERTDSDEDAQLQQWAEKKGLSLDSDNAVKAAKMAREAEKAMHSKAQKASELEKSMTEMSDTSAEEAAYATGQNPEVLKRIQRMEVKDSIRDFWASNPEAKQYEQEMAKIAVEAGLYGTPEAILKASYAMAVAGNQGALKSQGKREALQSLASKQQAAVPTGNATNAAQSSQSITPQNVEKLIARNGHQWFVKNYDAINRAMAG